MAGADRMTIEEVVRKVLLDEHADVIREAVKAITAEMMELEVSELIGAERGERRPDDRATHRNGYRPRRWDTRAGEAELQIPKIRQGSYFPSFLEPRRRSEQALLAVVQHAYVCGVSTRRVDQLVERLGLRISKSEVSRVCQALDEDVDAFRTRPWEGRKHRRGGPSAPRPLGWRAPAEIDDGQEITGALVPRPSHRAAASRHRCAARSCTRTQVASAARGSDVPTGHGGDR